MEIEPKILIEKCQTPIVWLDTSVITNLYVLQNTPEKLEPIALDRLQRIYELISKFGKFGKIICPLAGQKNEIWNERGNWLDTINKISLGIECVSLGVIEQTQLYNAMSAFSKNEDVINLSYKDLFFKDPISELNEILSEPFYVVVNSDIIFGADYHRKENPRVLGLLNEQREKNYKNKISFEKQFESEIMASINTLLEINNDFYQNKIQADQEVDLNNLFGAINLSEQVHKWDQLNNNKKGIDGLLSFYKSAYYRNLPFPNLTSALFAKIMISPQSIRSGDPMDIKHISTLMPFSDLFITDKAWSVFLNEKKYNIKYKTNICYVGDIDKIERFFQELS